MPASPAASGSARRDRSRRSPRSNSRRASSPTTKKKNVMRPLLTQPRRSRATDQSSSRISSSLVQKELYDEVATLAQISAMSAPARRNAALPASVLRNRCRGVAMLLTHALVPVNDGSDCAPPSAPFSLTRTTLSYLGTVGQPRTATSAPCTFRRQFGPVAAENGRGGRTGDGGDGLSERGFVELHERVVGGFRDRTLGGEPGQHLAGEEPGRRDLALVEGLVPAAGTLGELGECDLGLTQQQ